MERMPFDAQIDTPGVARRAMAEQVEPGVFTVTVTPTDADALGVRPNVHFTATPTKCWLKARYEGHAHRSAR
jgi:hypothetical protein